MQNNYPHFENFIFRVKNTNKDMVIIGFTTELK